MKNGKRLLQVRYQFKKTKFYIKSFVELSPTQVVLRKLITLNDLTLCLDKRNAAGKIDIYQEPMLYRCSLTMHLLRSYHSATAKKASTTRLHIYCNKYNEVDFLKQFPHIFFLEWSLA